MSSNNNKDNLFFALSDLLIHGWGKQLIYHACVNNFTLFVEENTNQISRGSPRDVSGKNIFSGTKILNFLFLLNWYHPLTIIKTNSTCFLWKLIRKGANGRKMFVIFKSRYFCTSCLKCSISTKYLILVPISLKYHIA